MKSEKMSRIGEIYKNNQNENMKIIDYDDCHHMKVQFEDGTIVEAQYVSFLKGEIRNPNTKIPTRGMGRIGEEINNNQGCLMKIIEYNRCDDIIIEFQDNHKSKVNTSYSEFKNGTICNPTLLLDVETINKEGCLMKCIEHIDKFNIIIEFQDKYKFKRKTTVSKFMNKNITNPYNMTVFGVACIGNTSTVKSKRTKKLSALCWYSMIERCYDEKFRTRHPTYKDCSVCDEWLCFENFEKWWNKNYNKNIINPQLDKDIIKFNNKMYCPNYCAIIPRELNTRITRFWNRNNIGKSFPVGVCYEPRTNNYSSRIRMNNKVVQKYFKDKEECLDWYLTMKEIELRRIAEIYKDVISENVYIGLKEQIKNYKIYCNYNFKDMMGCDNIEI